MLNRSVRAANHMRAVIYARYSSDLQRAASIDDQHEVCRRYLEAMGWTLVRTYDDAALSGGDANRPAFQQMLADAHAHVFDVIVVENIDRFGRKIADVAAAFDRLVFHKVKLYAVNVGEVTTMHVGIMGTMAQMFLADLRDKTLRGQLGRARAGRIPGGLAYGYDVVAPAPGGTGAGERAINEAQADIVRRIFREYGTGKSPRQIARDLNAAGVTGPDGRPWIDTTIRGQAERGTGILNNTVYVGKLSWNRCSYVKDPQTGKRVARPNPQEHWEVIDVPNLRIVDDETWERAKARQSEKSFEMGRDDSGNPLNKAHQRQFLLSGLLKCGCCGGGYTIMGKDRYGCATRRSKGICNNGTTITRQAIEARVLGGLKDRMLAPELVAEFVQAYAAELAAADREATQERSRAEADLADVERRLTGVTNAIENGAWNETLKARLTELEKQRGRFASKLAQESPARPVAQLHPGAANLYRQQVADLEAALNDAEVRLEAADALRGLIERVVLTPAPEEANGLRVELYGDLATILAMAEGSVGLRPVRSGGVAGPSVRVGQLSVVAGTGFEPVTFRL